ncbi:MAG: hypothetical protein ACI4NG_01615 [Candidatus Gallimonas sp.]
MQPQLQPLRELPQELQPQLQPLRELPQELQPQLQPLRELPQELQPLRVFRQVLQLQGSQNRLSIARANALKQLQELQPQE